ncbi:hypothetical protein G5A66_08505 [Dorea phocaeensis]|uniref:CbbX protein n=2 Tax=Dorea phocaeensis TaxID=2040291 RepID=A0A850HS96_9FIRM|nr:hypothetical protein [Dorea phocaeensis]NVH58683.1 hypothetical protein [Dorea phocaeensis]
MSVLDKYEYRVKTEQMLEYMEKKQYKKAMEIADTIDWRRVKSVSMLNTVSEIYELNGEFQKSRDILFVAFDRSPGSRKIVYRLGTLALKIDDTDEASDCYEEFVKLAPKDPNQYILKYKILKAQGAPLEDQIAALEDFKKGEYVEKWAYELAKLYHEAGMTAECLEECDDLILWFSEGKYVYQAMELKMKYKPLTPMQQEKYNNSPAGKQKARAMQLQKEKEEEKAAYQQKALKAKAAAEAARAARMAAQAAEEEEPEEAEDDLEESGDVSEEMEVPNNVIEEVAETISEEMDEDSFEEGEMLPEESEEVDEEEPKEEDTMKQSSITKVVKGATLQEALANGVALASGRSLNIEEKAMKEKDEALRVTGQMRIEDILQEWEAKQKQNAEAIEQQKQKDVERIQKEREEAERRREEERLEIERKAAEAEAARKAAEEEAARKAAEEEAARKAAEEEAARKAAEEEAARKAAIEEAAKLAGEEDVAAAGLGETRRIPDDIVKLMEEMGLQEKEEAEDEPEELSLEDALAAHGAEEIIGEMDEEAFEEADYEEGDYEEADFEEEDFEEADYEEADFEEEEFEEAAAEEADFEEEDFEEADYEEADFEEEDFEETDYEEADYEDDFEADFGEEVEADFEDDLEADFEDDFEADFEDDFEEEFEEADYEEDDFFDEEAEEEDEEADFEEEELEIEEPSEEEIQARIKKSKGSGVPFDTGFVVTGRYDLSATSEIGLKAGLTEEQKKLFSYFVPVRGMSEQIVEVLDNDRRAQREGTSKTGNLMVIGRKGSGKTVLAVDIVKAIQKQRNLKQGKVAIVTGESLNKKELTNIIQKLRGGAIIIEKAGKLNSRTIKELNYLMEKKTGELLFVLEDQRKPLERLLTANPDFRKKFTSKLELPVFINDELVTFGQTYAKENGYKLDEMGILALYSRIDVMQREDHAVTVAEVKEIMDEAIAHSQKANVKHLARRVFGKSTDDSDRIILKEEDFKI